MEAADTALSQWKDDGIHIAGAIVEAPGARYRVIRNTEGEWAAIVYCKTVDKERKRSPWIATRGELDDWLRDNLPKPRRRKKAKAS